MTWGGPSLLVRLIRPAAAGSVIGQSNGQDGLPSEVIIAMTE